MIESTLQITVKVNLGSEKLKITKSLLAQPLFIFNDIMS